MEWSRYRHLNDQLPEGEKLPTPDVPPWLVWLWRAWHRLHVDRPMVPGGMGPAYPGRISWSVVMEWADRHGYCDADREMLDECVRAMDTEYLTWWRAQQPEPTKR